LTDAKRNQYRTCDYTLSMPAPANTALQAYPNPASDRITIEHESIKAGDIIEIFGMSGNRIGRYTANGTQTTIELSGYAQGIYVVRVNGKEAKIVKK